MYYIETIVLHTIAVYSHLCNCLVIITIKYRLALHACHHSYGGGGGPINSLERTLLIRYVTIHITLTLHFILVYAE